MDTLSLAQYVMINWTYGETFGDFIGTLQTFYREHFSEHEEREQVRPLCKLHFQQVSLVFSGDHS